MGVIKKKRKKIREREKDLKIQVTCSMNKQVSIKSQLFARG